MRIIGRYNNVISTSTVHTTPIYGCGLSTTITAKTRRAQFP